MFAVNLQRRSHVDCIIASSTSDEQESRRAAGQRSRFAALQVDDVLRTGLTERFDVLTDKGTLDAIGLSETAADDRCLHVSCSPIRCRSPSSCNTGRPHWCMSCLPLLQMTFRYACPQSYRTLPKAADRQDGEQDAHLKVTPPVTVPPPYCCAAKAGMLMLAAQRECHAQGSQRV